MPPKSSISLHTMWHSICQQNHRRTWFFQYQLYRRICVCRFLILLYLFQYLTNLEALRFHTMSHRISLEGGTTRRIHIRNRQHEHKRNHELCRESQFQKNPETISFSEVQKIFGHSKKVQKSQKNNPKKYYIIYLSRTL